MPDWYGIEGIKGSSPLTRGKPGGYSETLKGLRLIPAHAGKTCLIGTGLKVSRAHPRSRGENPFVWLTRLVWRGSSPLTRGKLSHSLFLSAGVGLIPAHAGKTCRPRSGVCWGAAHPRSRGENVMAVQSACAPAGSSPLTRGKLTEVPQLGWPYRLIPAHAGKTAGLRMGATPLAAHPRSRGENPKTRSDRLLDPGSSPLTRGKLHGRRQHVRRHRLIPAHAGKTLKLAQIAF